MLRTDLFLIESFGSGFLEDIIPFMTNIYPTQRWKNTIKEIDKLLAFMKKLVKEHEDTFDPSEYELQFFFYLLFRMNYI